MKYCNACKLHVRGNGGHCPLCFSELSLREAEDTYEGYPERKESPEKNRFIFRLCLFLSLAVSLICLVINLLNWSGLFWSLIVATGILLLWETVGFLLLRKNIGWRLLAQMVTIIIVSTTVDAVTGWHAWSISYLTPLVIIASSFAMTLIFCLKRAQWREYILFQLIIAINGFVPVILYLFGLTTVLWPSAAGAVYAVLSLLGMMIFFNKQFENEMKKRFHI